MKQHMQELFSLANQTEVTPVQLLVAAAPILRDVEKGEPVADEVWLMIPSDMRPSLLTLLINIMLQASAKRQAR